MAFDYAEHTLEESGIAGPVKSHSASPRVVAAAYMTGVLPIKKDGSQSGISDFQEYAIQGENGIITVFLYMLSKKNFFPGQA